MSLLAPAPAVLPDTPPPPPPPPASMPSLAPAPAVLPDTPPPPPLPPASMPSLAPAPAVLPDTPPPPPPPPASMPSLAPAPATPDTAPPPPPPPASTSSPTPIPAGLIVGIVIGGLIVLVVIVLVGVGIFVIFYRKRRRRPEADPSAASAQPSQPAVALSIDKGMALGLSQSTFTYEELKVATDGFSDLNLLGQGGFGYVHKGVLSSGKVVAIKQLKAGNGQGEREFQAEVEIISRIHHRHLVSLVGYCISGAQRILVYEFVPNSTLEFHLHGKDRPTMAWPTRMKIALGSARGLAYLHEECNPKIIHRDIKGSNILLDLNFEAKVADFGLAKLASDTDTHVTTRVMGTFGYLAPEYASSGKLTEKSDVFSFGVVLLELITGRRPVDKTRPFLEDSLVDWARPLLKQALEDGKFDAIIHPKLHRNYNSKEVIQMIACAAACVRHFARHRPQMTQIVRALEGNLPLSELNEGIVPVHSGEQATSDLNKSWMTAMESQEQPTSEFSGPSSEHGLQPSSSSSGVQ